MSSTDITASVEQPAAHSAMDRVVAGLLRFRRVVVPVTLITIWVIVSMLVLVRPLILPPPWALWDSFQDLAPLLPSAILTSTSMTLTGFLLGTLLGAGLGLLMAYSRTARELFGAVLDFTRPVPIFALIPLFILWFGIGRAPQIALIALGTSVILGLTTLEAVRNVPPIYLRAALTLGASRRRIYRTVVVPYIVPQLVGAIRVAAAAAWGLGVAAEFMGSQQGLGYLIVLQQTYLRTAGIVVLVLVYSLLAVSVDLVIAAIERRVTRWTERRGGFGVVASLVGK